MQQLRFSITLKFIPDTTCLAIRQLYILVKVQKLKTLPKKRQLNGFKNHKLKSFKYSLWDSDTIMGERVWKGSLVGSAGYIEARFLLGTILVTRRRHRRTLLAVTEMTAASVHWLVSLQLFLTRTCACVCVITPKSLLILLHSKLASKRTNIH